MKESLHQSALFRWAKYSIPEYEPLLFHIPNGGSRNIIEAANLKKQGVKGGVPDIFLAVARGEFHGLFIELKSEVGRASKSQIKMIDSLKAQGYCASIIYGWEDASELIKDYLGVD